MKSFFFLFYFKGSLYEEREINWSELIEQKSELFDYYYFCCVKFIIYEMGSVLNTLGQ